MLVILKENVGNLGRIGDLVKVPDGYARNFLIPNKLVVQANEKNVAAIEHHKKILDKKRAAHVASAEELASKLGKVTCQIARKVGANSKIFGSVTNADIAAELEKAGFPVDKKLIRLDAPVKALGNYTVTINLDADVKATIQVTVIKEE